MIDQLKQMFEDEKMVERIKSKLPYMFFIAEVEMSKSGKVGMEVGTLREQIIIALLIIDLQILTLSCMESQFP